MDENVTPEMLAEMVSNTATDPDIPSQKPDNAPEGKGVEDGDR